MFEGDRSVIYDADCPDNPDIYDISLFKTLCYDGTFVDYDGFGYPAKPANGVLKMADNLSIYPSNVHLIPDDATHIVWFNR